MNNFVQKTSEENRDHWLNTLFKENADVFDAADFNARQEAFVSLAYQFLESLGGRYEWDALQFDYHAIRLMMARFQRDAFGLGSFSQHMENLKSSGKISDEIKKEIETRVHDLGLRIGSENPRKTRMAAAFSLWMCVFRPVSIERKDGDDLFLRERFCAGFNWFLASNFLMKFGEVKVGTDTESARKIRERIFHDFTFREVNLSSLEILYCSVFHARPNRNTPAKL